MAIVSFTDANFAGTQTSWSTTVTGWQAGETMAALLYFTDGTATVSGWTMTGESAPANFGTVRRGGPSSTSLQWGLLSNVTGTGSKTITATITGAGATGKLIVWRLSGRDTAGAFDAENGTSGTLTSLTCTATASGAGTDCLSGLSIGHFNPGSISGWTARSVQDFNQEDAADIANQPAGTINGAWTWGGTSVTAVGTMLLVKAGPVTPTVAGISDSSPQRGSFLTVTGTNFGATQGASTVTFDGASPVVTAWSDTSITIIVPDLTARRNGVAITMKVTVGGTDSNTFSIPAGLRPIAGRSYVNLGTLAGSGLIETTPALTAGWQVEFEDPAVVNTDGTWSAPAYLPAFAIRVHDGTSWGATGLQILMTARLGLFDPQLRLLGWY